MTEIATHNSNLPATVYKPSEMIGIFNSILARQNENAKVVYLRGIYLANPKVDPRWTYCYDILRDEDNQMELTLKLTHKQRESLKNGNLVLVGGVLGRQLSENNGSKTWMIIAIIAIIACVLLLVLR